VIANRQTAHETGSSATAAGYDGRYLVVSATAVALAPITQVPGDNNA
jgi:hypothetical protein